MTSLMPANGTGGQRHGMSHFAPRLFACTNREQRAEAVLGGPSPNYGVQQTAGARVRGIGRLGAPAAADAGRWADR